MSRPPPNEIYTAFINHPQYALLETDRTDLHTKRGFSDEVIALAHFGSARPENAQIVAELQSQFERDRLIDSGLLSLHSGTVEVCRQLLEPGTIIPYLADPVADAPPGAYHLRIHKLGFKGVPIQFYCAGNQTEEVVLAESEFKAVAAYCLGYSAIGIPGISSFCREHFPKLVTHILNNAILRIVVCFDNEIKDNPDFPNYKPEPEKRWDTNYYAALMARRLAEHCNIETAIATLPDAWRANGKIDIDGALAASHTSEEFAAVIGGAIRVNDYIDSLPADACRIVNRKLEAFRLSMRIKRNTDGYLVSQKDMTGTETWVNISNFTMDIQSKIQTRDGLERTVKARKGTTVSDNFRIKPVDMVKPDSFQQALYRHGNGEMWFRGSKDHLVDIWDLEHNRGPEAVIVEPDHVGKINDDMWLFGSSSLINGKIVKPDANGVFWNGVKGYSIPEMVLNEEEGGRKWTSRIPRPDFSGGEIDFKEIALHLYENFGGDEGGQNAVIALAWSIACAYSNDFYDEFECFPIMYLCGQKESGKSTLARWMLRMHGIMNKGFNVKSATTPGVIRQLSYYGSLPVFLDECRDMDEGNKESILRSAYDRQPVVKASREGGDNAIVALPVRSPVMIAGESVPKDPALFSRCIFPEFSADRKGFGSQYSWLEPRSRTLFPKILPWLLLHGPAAKNLVERAQNFCEALQKTYSARISRNYGIIFACHHTIVDPNDELKIELKILKMAESAHEDTKEDSDIHRFFEDLSLLRTQNEIRSGTDYDTDGVVIRMNFRRCWEAWMTHQRDIPGSKPFNSNTALRHLKGMKFLEKYNHPHRLDGEVRKCIVVRLDISLGCPQILIDFANQRV